MTALLENLPEAKPRKFLNIPRNLVNIYIYTTPILGERIWLTSFEYPIGNVTTYIYTLRRYGRILTKFISYKYYIIMTRVKVSSELNT